jgi:hypothetical protein
MSSQGIVSARHVDHVGMTVPSLNEAIHFLRLGPNLNVELQTFEAEQQEKRLPSNVDSGATHIGFFVEDIRVAAASLAGHGAELLHGPIETAGDAKRESRFGTLRDPGVV